jgi:urea carboxylase
MREDFPQGRFALRVENTTLRLSEQRRFLSDHAQSIAAFKARQQLAFEEERERWQQSGAALVDVDSSTPAASLAEVADIPEGCVAVGSPVTGSVWQVSVAPGARVAAGDTLIVVEAMKMEVPISAEQAAEVIEVRGVRGRTVMAGETVLVLRPI